MNQNSRLPDAKQVLFDRNNIVCTDILGRVHNSYQQIVGVYHSLIRCRPRANPTTGAFKRQRFKTAVLTLVFMYGNLFAGFKG
jgi:hypothetical protein